MLPELGTIPPKIMRVSKLHFFPNNCTGGDSGSSCGLVDSSEVVDNNELMSVSLVKADSKHYIHIKVRIRVPLRDAHQITPQMHPFLFTHNTTPTAAALLGSPVVPFCPFSFWVPLLTPNRSEMGTLIVKGLLGNPAKLSPKP